MKLPVNRVTGILNGFFNPLLLCAFLPIIEGAPGLDLTSPTGFWGQLIVATVIAEVLSALPLFGKTVGMCLDFFGFERGSASHKIAGTVIGATLLFMVIGVGEIAFRGGFGTIEGRTFFARWAGLVTKGWAFVVIAGVLLDPFTAALGRMAAREEVLVYRMPADGVPGLQSSERLQSCHSVRRHSTATCWSSIIFWILLA